MHTAVSVVLSKERALSRLRLKESSFNSVFKKKINYTYGKILWLDVALACVSRALVDSGCGYCRA